jgi:hypothetical protein
MHVPPPPKHAYTRSMGRRLPAGLAFATLLALAAPLAAQEGQGYNRYEMQCGGGNVADVSLYDLTSTVVSYDRRAVRTKGRLEINVDPTIGGRAGRAYVLRDMSSAVLILPVPEMAGQLEEMAMSLMGHEVEVTGCFYGMQNADPTQQAMQQVGGAIQTWKLLGPPEKPTKSVLDASKLLSLEGLLSNPDRYDGQTVKVVGMFRGRNLYGDLPSRSQRNSSDWVIKDDVYACWIVGKKPKGDGFELDAGLKRDTNKWLEVVGRVATRGPIVYLQAVYVGLTKEPRPAAEVKAAPLPPEKPKVPPVVVFALPLDGEQDVPRSSRFVVQFSKDMDETSFKGRVVVRYLGPVQPGDKPFDGVKLNYDQGRRALEVDPGDNLRTGRTIELLLLPGINDVDGLELKPRRGEQNGDGALDVLRYKVG